MHRYRGRVEINGLPLHPLVVHAAVVLAPLAALLGLAYAAREEWRWVLRWPLVVVAVLAVGAVGVSFLSGRSLLSARSYLNDNPRLHDAIALHRARARWFLGFSVAFGASALFAAWALGGPSALLSGRGARVTRARWGLAARILVVAAAVGVLVTAGLTGDAGARAVWGQ